MNAAERLQIARENEAAYRQNNEIRTELTKVAFSPIVGISGAGKSTLIDLLVTRFPERYHFVKSRTTRPQKPTEAPDAMHFIDPGDEVAMMALSDDIESGEFVQYTIHPETQVFYGTKPEDYDATKINLMPTLASTLSKLEQVSFGRFEPVVIIPDIDAWQKIFLAQPYSPSERRKRLHEAEQSLTISLARTSMLWLRNKAGAPEEAATELDAILTTHTNASDEPRAIARRLLEVAVQPLLQRENERHDD